MLSTARLLLGRVPAWGWAILAAVAAVFILWRLVDGYGDRRYAEGVDRADARWVAKIEADKKAQAEREARATATLIQQRQRDQVAAEQRKTEIDNATRNLPDQAPTTRQRVRACLELQRQAKTSGGPFPSC